MQFIKRSILLVILAGSFASVQTAQAQSRQRWSFGPRVGLNLTNFVGNDIQDAMRNNSNANKLLPGLSAGLGFMYSDISRFGFGVDLLYSQRGSRTTYTSNGTEYTGINRVNYLELPLAGRYFLTAGGRFRPNIYLGAVPALRLNANNQLKANGNISRADNKDFFRPADLGLMGGIQLNFGMGARQHFTIDARYIHGITNISTGTNDLRNQMITLGLGYNFGIGREYQPGDRKLPIRPITK